MIWRTAAGEGAAVRQHPRAGWTRVDLHGQHLRAAQAHDLDLGHDAGAGAIADEIGELLPGCSAICSEASSRIELPSIWPGRAGCRCGDQCLQWLASQSITRS